MTDRRSWRRARARGRRVAALLVLLGVAALALSAGVAPATAQANEPPVAVIEVKPPEARVGEAVEFKGSGSEDPDGTIVKYIWDFGDGTKAEGEIATHEYATPGEYEVILTVVDNHGLPGEESEWVYVYDAPTAVTETASEITQVSATLGGTVNPNGANVTGCTFEYGETEAYGKEAPCSALPGFELEPVAVAASIVELAPGTRYHYRVVAENIGGKRAGEDKAFTTKGPPAIAAEAATSVTQAAASLNATVAPDGAEVTKCEFEYGAHRPYDKTVPCATLPAGAGTAPVAVTAAIEGLTAGTTYHFRLVATSAEGAGEGADATFATAALPKAELKAPAPSEEVKPPLPDDTFTASAAFSRSNGAITLSATVKDPGTFALLATFANGQFGAFSATAKCKKSQLKLAGKCRPARITFARGTVTVSAAGTVKLTIKPGASARRALQSAFKHKKGLPVTITLTFQSARGGTPTSRTLALVVKLNKS